MNMNIENESVVTQLIRLNIGRVYASVHMHVRELAIDNVCVVVGYCTVSDAIENVSNSIRANLQNQIEEYGYRK